MAESLSRRIVRAARAIAPEDIPASVIAKVKIGLLDFLSCVYESQALPWGCQALQLGDTAFSLGVLGHGLVREDMHTGAVSHLGVVIYPALLSLRSANRTSGLDFIRAAACGYEAAASVGRALITPEFVQLHRPTGTTGPIGAALAGALLLWLNEDAAVSAIGLAANTASGLNEWPYSGADDMFFHPGFAARNAVACVQLAASGARGSETALDGRAGLFASLGLADRANSVAPFRNGHWEILDVYYKPAPACNYAQTACQAALSLIPVDPNQIADVVVKCSAAAVAYPGCNFAGPFERVLQAKMSIQFCVAATLAHGRIAESNYRDLDHSEVLRLARTIRLEADEKFTAAYPARQGAAITITLRNGETRAACLDDVVPASDCDIRARFSAACPNARELAEFIDSLEARDDIAPLTRLL